MQNWTALGATSSPTEVTLAWNASSSSSVTGYRVYYGGASQVYTNMIDVGSALTATISNLTPGITYFFAVTAYDATGVESTFSNEISYTVPAVPIAQARIQMEVTGSKQVTLTGTAPAGTTYTVLVSQNLTTWTSLGTVTAGAGGAVQFTDPAGLSSAMRYYRLQQTSP
ncbi:MAG TPA: fibronectin type III domain-containing protein [Clostridia bacterium]|nr:fibronectin type III domain-containing protein [Clostridia bacterium]